MVRQYTPLAQSTPQALECLQVLADARTSPAKYRLAMRQAGVLLADSLSKAMVVRSKIIHVAFSSEDADFVAGGFVERLENLFAHVRIACFWNRADSVFGLPWLKQASIVREYYDNLPGEADLYVFIRSILADDEATNLNLSRLSDDAGKGPICVAAPVVFMGAVKRAVQEDGKLLTFAMDDVLDPSGNVLPGIGGDVCERLNLEKAQTDIVPAIVKSRLFNPDRLVPSGERAVPRYVEEPVRARRLAKSFGKRDEGPGGGPKSGP